MYDTAARSAPQYRDKTDGRNEIGKIKNNEDVICMCPFCGLVFLISKIFSHPCLGLHLQAFLIHCKLFIGSN